MAAAPIRSVLPTRLFWYWFSYEASSVDGWLSVMLVLLLFLLMVVVEVEEEEAFAVIIAIVVVVVSTNDEAR